MNTEIRIPEGTALHGRIISLQPLQEAHFEELIACARDPQIWEHYRHDFTNPRIMRDALEQALKLRAAGNQYPFAVYHHGQKKLIGSTRLMDIQPAHRTLEIGFTWYERAFWASAVNPECKLLLLSYCFGSLQAARVALQADEHNIRSRQAIQKIGGVYEGTLRSNMLRDNGTRRSSAYYSILAEEWPDVKPRIEALLAARQTERSLFEHSQPTRTIPS